MAGKFYAAIRMFGIIGDSAELSGYVTLPVPVGSTVARYGCGAAYVNQLLMLIRLLHYLYGMVICVDLSRENARLRSSTGVIGPTTPAGSTADTVGPQFPEPVMFG